MAEIVGESGCERVCETCFKGGPFRADVIGDSVGIMVAGAICMWESFHGR